MCITRTVWISLYNASLNKIFKPDIYFLFYLAEKFDNCLLNAHMHGKARVDLFIKIPSLCFALIESRRIRYVSEASKLTPDMLPHSRYEQSEVLEINTI